MPLRPGDIVTIGLNPTIPLWQYTSIKPFVSIGRTMGDNPQADYDDAVAALKTCAYQVAEAELHVVLGTVSALGGNHDVEAALSHVKNEIANAKAETHTQKQKPVQVAGTGVKAKPSPKAKG